MHPARTLLLIDDDAITRELLSLLLVDAGWLVTAAAGGEEALDTLTFCAIPSAVLSDLQMPGLCGTPLASALRRAAPSMVVMAMTATLRTHQPEGYDALLIKPFEVQEVALHYSAVVQKKKSAAPRQGTQAPIQGPVLNPTVLERLGKAMTMERLHALLSFVADDADLRVNRMHAAVVAKDRISYRNEAHALKGSSSMVGASRLSMMAAHAEEEGLPDDTAGEWQCAADFASATAEIRLMLKTLSRDVV